MKTPEPHDIRDEEIDAFLARGYRDTTPEFEARWVSLKRELRQQPPRARTLPWIWSLGFLAAGLAAIILVVPPAPPAGPARPDLAAASTLAELWAMDAVLDRGLVLLDADSRLALLHLPAHSVRPN